MSTPWEMELHARYGRERLMAEAEVAARHRLATSGDAATANTSRPGGVRRYFERFSLDRLRFSSSPVLYQVTTCGDRVRR